MESNEISKNHITPMPWKKLIGAYVLLLCEAISATSFFTYISPFIIFLGVTDKKELVGYYAGFIASSFSAAQFLSSFFWGKMADKLGRKPILIFGSVGSVISLLCIGTSKSLIVLILSRSLNGLLNGNIGVIKTYIGECTDKTNQIEAFGWVGLTFGLGSILGPSIGGLLADPVHNMPSIFEGSKLFTLFPFFLPNMVIAFLTIVGCVFTQLYMKETLGMKKSKTMIGLTSLKTSPSMVKFSDKIETIEPINLSTGILEDDENNNNKNNNTDNGNIDDEEENNKIKSILRNGLSEINISNSSEYSIENIDTGSILTVGTVELDENETEQMKKNLINSTEKQQQQKDLNQIDQEINIDQSSSSSSPNLKPSLSIFEDMALTDNNTHFLKRSYSKLKLKFFKSKDDYKMLGTKSNDNTNSSMMESEELEESTNIFKDKSIMKTVLIYAIIGFIYTMLDEVFPLWAFTEASKGGLSMNSGTVGVCGIIGGVSVICIQLFIIKPVTRKFGIIQSFIYGCSIGIFSFVSYPLLNLVSPYQINSSITQHVIFWISITIVISVRNIGSQFVFTPIMTLINNSAKIAVRGSANGLGQSLVAATRTIAPTLGGTILSWSLTNGLPFPFNFFFVFILMGIVMLIPLITSKFFFPHSLNAPIDEDDDNSLESDENQIPTFE
ncbi:hypothetical protein ACTFIU_008950 [Dictyostelium citrinum]